MKNRGLREKIYIVYITYIHYINTLSHMHFFTKKVSFSNLASVVLIPCRKDMVGIKHLLWYCDVEYAKFARDEMERRALKKYYALT